MTPPMREAGRSSRVVASIPLEGRLEMDAVYFVVVVMVVGMRGS